MIPSYFPFQQNIYTIRKTYNLHYEKFQDGTVKCIEGEIPFDVPEGWSWCRLPSISIDIFAGGDKPKTYSKTKSEICQVPIYSNGIENGGLYGYTNEARVIYPSITISARGTIGFCCIRKIPFVPIVRLITITPSIEIDLHYLNTVFEVLMETGEGSSIPQLTVPGIKPKLIPIPPIKEQNRIHCKTEKMIKYVTDISLEKEELSAIIKNTKSKILDLAIRGKLVSKKTNDEPASVFLKRIREEKEELIRQGKIKRDKRESVIFKGDDNSYYEKIGDVIKNIDSIIPFNIPDNWEFVRFKKIWELISGRDLSPSEYNDKKIGIPYITGASNFKNGYIELVRWTPNPQVITHAGDLLITCKGTIGEMAVNDLGDAHIARQIMAIRNKFNLNVEYLSYCICFYLNTIKESAKGLIPGISREDILDLILPIPPEEYQKGIVSFIEKTSSLLSSIEKSLN